MANETMLTGRFRQRLMYRMMELMAREQPRRLGEMIEAIFSHSPEFFDPDAPSNAGPHFVHPYTEFTEEMREELRLSDEDYERISNGIRQTLTQRNELREHSLKSPRRVYLLLRYVDLDCRT